MFVPCLLSIDVSISDIFQDPSLDANFWLRFLLQVFLILLFCRILGDLLGYIKQPPVIGEMLAGIIIGPSLLGQSSWWAIHIFQPTSISSTSSMNLTLVADLGIVLFMFLMGLELDHKLVKKMWRTAAPIAIVSVLFPFGVGIVLAIWLSDINNSYLSEPMSNTAFYLYTAASMSFTALPVLASLLAATRLINTPIGILTISCATFDDILAWCLLAISTSFATGNGTAGIITCCLAFIYVLIMILIFR